MICGQIRSIDLVIDKINEIFKDFDICLYICLSINNNIDNGYINKIDFDLLKYKTLIKKIIYIKSSYDNSFRNSLNYSKKINDILQLIDDNYDYYLILRTDLILDSINFLNDINDEDIYFSSKKNNEYIKDIKNKINSDIIISKNFNNLLKLKKIHKLLLNNNNYLEIMLFKFLNEENIKYEYIDINYKLVLSKCNIIAISGDSGSGKSTLLNYLTPIFKDNGYIKLETDRYHKWERGDKNYDIYTHLNPESNYLEKMSEDIYKLKIGKDIYSVDYDHNTGKFIQEEKITSKNNLLICGLHTLYNEQTNKLINLKIYMDTDRELIKKWKINRDVNERGHLIEKVLKQIEIREIDYKKYIKEQKNNSDLIINFFEENNLIKCNLIVINYNLEMITELMTNKYNIIIDDNKYIIIKLNYNVNSNNYFNEIIIIIKMLLMY